jgi:hypothetical protein
MTRHTALLLLGLGCAAATFANEVTDWNKIMLSATLTAPITPAPVSTRIAAIVQTAVFDAINGIDRVYTPIHVEARGPRGASERAAAIQAAYATLAALYPNQKSRLDQQRTASLALITREPQDAVQQGISWGQSVADQILAWRSQDGFSNTVAPYIGSMDPGQWRPTPPANASGLAPQLAQTRPFVIPSASQFRPNGPPALNSDQYTADYNETKLMGSATGSLRTAEQSLLATFWNGGNPPDYWDQVATSLTQQRQFSLIQTARALAVTNTAMADAIIGCWDAKYAFSSWRPVTAIRLGDTDGNDATAPDPSWTPLITTPPFPEYPSAHSCASGAASRVLSLEFGEQSKLEVVSLTMPDVTRRFYSFTAILDEIKTARIVGGIHFRSACTDGQALGTAIADYVLQHAALPVGNRGRRPNMFVSDQTFREEP